MNTIGLDYQQTLTVACLSEGMGASARMRSIGDGQRPLIPNAVEGAELWGSRVSSASDRAPEELQDSPWLSEPEAPQFWGHLYKRVYSFLGRTAPTSQNGYRTVIGLQATNYEAACAGVQRLSEQAGFGTPTCIPATDAVLARHLVEQRGGEPGDSTIAVVVAGDTSTVVCCYRIRRESGMTPRIIAHESAPHRLPFGQAHWTGRLLIHVNDLFTEPIQPSYRQALRNAALEYGARLRRAPEGRAVPWTGPLRDKLYAPLQLTPDECRSWPEAARVISDLPDLLRDSARSLASSGRPDLILVGGVGAIWPFAIEAAGTVGRVQLSDTPEEDVARGAAWWPEVETLWSDVVSTPSTANASLSGWMVDMPPTQNWLADLPKSEENSLFGLPPKEENSFFSFPPTQESAIAPALPPEPIAPSKPEYDILQQTPAVAVNDEEDDLDNLPPWDPRRNEV